MYGDSSELNTYAHLMEQDGGATLGRAGLHVAAVLWCLVRLLGNIRCLPDDRSGFMSSITRDKQIFKLRLNGVFVEENEV